MRLFFSSVAMIAACTPAPTPVSPQHDADAMPSPTSDVCSAACATLDRLGCPESKGMGGRTCLATCQHDTPAVVFDLHVACVAAASDVAAVRKCGVGCAQ